MTKELEIREDYESRWFVGQYKPHVIRIRPNLNTCEKALTLKHELYHAHFFEETTIGKMCALFFKKKIAFAYLVSLFLSWVFFPWAYILLLFPVVTVRIHEIQTSILYPSRLSFSLSVLTIVALLALLWLRLRV